MTAAARRARERLVEDHDLRGEAFGRALAAVVDDSLRTAARGIEGSSAWAVVALGSYARRELCPGSDLDVMLLHRGPRRTAPDADAAGGLWYPLWDAGFVLGQSVRSVKEALAVADEDLDALTALLDVRLVTGDAALVDELVQRIRQLAPRRRDRLVDALADAAAARLEHPGPIAEMLEPDLKSGGGGLRDLQTPGWAGWSLPTSAATAAPPDGRAWDRGLAILVERGYLQAGDPERLREARALLLDARVALHRITGGRSDRLPLQEQDAVSGLLGMADADALMRTLGAAARAVVWITREQWARLRAAEAGPSLSRSASRDLGDGVVLRDGRIALLSTAPIDTTTVVRAAARAAALRVPFERPTLDRLAELAEVRWDEAARAELVALLAAGRGAIPVFESLDHVGLLVRLLPEWEHVRARPQRNAYHRFTVDRHSLEAVAECAALLDPTDPLGAGFDGEVARSARRDVLLLAALLHDMAKGRGGDHSVVGVEVARAVAARIGLDPAGTDELAWAVRHHLLLAETATRRDLGDARTISRFAETVGDTEHNALLYALTIGDSRATGTAAWNAGKASLVRTLYVETDAVLRAVEADVPAVDDARRELAAIVGEEAAVAYLGAMPASYARAFGAPELARHRDLLLGRQPAVDWAELPGDLWRCTVVEPDRTGLLATAAAALALVGFDIEGAVVASHPSGYALEVFTGHDRFGRLTSADDRARATATLSAALDGSLALDEELRARSRRYRPAAPTVDRDVRVLVDTDASDHATVVEVHAPDDIGLLARVAAVFVDLDLDVDQAIVATTGERVVDVFYLDDVSGARFARRHAVEALRATLLSRLTAAVTLDERLGPDG
jgi:[protein-PII] uridylyltransferase